MPTPIKNITGFELDLIKALRAIVAETMDYPPCRPSDDSYLPAHLIKQAQDALKLYGCNIEPNPAMMASGHDLVTGQPLQPVSVGSPGGIGVGGDTPVVVQVYAFGRGVTLATERGNLAGREGAFELEANGKIFVFDPLCARQAYGFVTAVEGDVSTVRLQLQAVDEKQLAEFRNGICHGDNSLKTAILSLPQGFGKTIMAKALLDKIGCQEIIDDWHPGAPIKPGALHLTNHAFFGWAYWSAA